ncbi:MAG: hypothetical protein JOZ75_15120 [Candidatus Dormibacteraeota bacterium]|nr:hypothetical protein [Candidatus Dormibacteraeota bacterium]
MSSLGAQRRARPASLALLSAAAIAACGSSTITAPSIVTVAQARAGARNYAIVDARAADQCSTTVNSTVETGDLESIDNAGDFSPAVCVARATPAPPSQKAKPATIPDNELVVPRATTHPAVFFQYADADLGHGEGKQPNIWVMESPRPGAPWKAAYQVQLSAGSLLTFRRDANGQAPALLQASAPGYQMTPDATCRAAADLFDAVYAESPNPPGLEDRSKVTAVEADYRAQDTQTATQWGVASSRAWSCAGNEIAEQTEAGEALVVFTLRGAYTFVPPPNVSFWLSRTYNGKDVRLVQPGYYKVVTATELIILAALVPKGASTGEPQLIGSYRGVVATTDTPAAGGELSPGPS